MVSVFRCARCRRRIFGDLLDRRGHAALYLACGAGQGGCQRFRHIVVCLCGFGHHAVDLGLHLFIGGLDAVDHLLAGLGGGLGDAVFDAARAVLDLFGESLDAGGHGTEGILSGSRSCSGDGRNDRFGGGL